MKLKLLTFICALGLFGCAHQVEELNFTPYIGQQNNWPTAAGGFVEQAHGINIYRTYPSQPYKIIGRISGVDLSNDQYASAAVEHGADAVVINKSLVVNGGQTLNVYSSSAYLYSTPHLLSIAWLVKYKTKTEARLDEISEALREAAANPNGADITNADLTVSHYNAEQIAATVAALKIEQAALLQAGETNSPSN